MAVDQHQLPVRHLARQQRVRVSDLAEQSPERGLLLGPVTTPITGIGYELRSPNPPKLLYSVSDPHPITSHQLVGCNHRTHRSPSSLVHSANGNKKAHV